MKTFVATIILAGAIWLLFAPPAVAKGYMLLLAALVCGLMWTTKAE